MVEAGENPRFIFRRMLIAAGEDIGLADPQAMVVVEACAAAFERVGLPEGPLPPRTGCSVPSRNGKKQQHFGLL
jgi:putative ATPase